MPEEIPEVAASTHARLVQAFAADTQVDNLTPEAVVEEPKAEESVEVIEPKPDEPEVEAIEEEVPEEEPFDEFEGKYLNAEELAAKYPRNASKALLAETARYSAEAKEASELKATLGGASFIPPVTKIAKGLQAERLDTQAIFEGVLEARGEEGLLPLVSQAVYTAFTSADDKSEFGIAMQLIADAAIKERFGADLEPDRIRRLAEWDTLGWFEALDKWTTAEEVDFDELEGLLAANKNPRVKSLAQENAQLRKQLEAKNNGTPTTNGSRESAIDAQFSSHVETQIGNIFTDVVLKNSPLRDIPTDTDEIKADKKFLRNQLTEKAIASFNRNGARQKLLSGLAQGRQGTAAWQKDFVEGIQSAIISTKDQKVKSEAMIAKTYGNTRNSQLSKPKTVVVDEPKKAPTVSEPQEKSTEPRTREQYLKNLSDAYERAAQR